MRAALGAWVVAVLVRCWIATLRVHRLGPPLTGPGVVAFWHGQQLPLLAIRPVGAVAPISRSRDGRFQARVMAHLGVGEVVGSSSRGALSAARGLRRAVAAGGIAVVAADGPRGPAQIAKSGAGWVASRCRAPLWPVAAAGRGWRLRTAWDGFFLPMPFSRVVIVVGEPVRLPADAPAAHAAAHVQAALEGAGALATQRWQGLIGNRVDAH